MSPDSVCRYFFVHLLWGYTGSPAALAADYAGIKYIYTIS